MQELAIKDLTENFFEAIGKEWMLGRNKQNILSVNLKLTLQGGDRYSPIDLEATMNHPDKEVQYDETKVFSGTKQLLLSLSGPSVTLTNL